MLDAPVHSAGLRFARDEPVEALQLGNRLGVIVHAQIETIIAGRRR
jgi:hypothetical protein